MNNFVVSKSGIIAFVIVLLGFGYVAFFFDGLSLRSSGDEGVTERDVNEVIGRALPSVPLSSLSGTISSIGPDSFELEVSQILGTNIPASSNLYTREVRITPTTVITERRPKTTQELNQELKNFTPGDPLPTPYRTTALTLHDLKAGDAVAVHAALGNDIREAKSFEAGTIIRGN